VLPIGRFARIYLGSTLSPGSVGNTRAPAAAATASVVDPESARTVPVLVLPTRKKPIAPMTSAAATATAMKAAVLRVLIAGPNLREPRDCC
jgi:hypothetical protein